MPEGCPAPCVVAVLGGAGGIGRALVQRLLADGASVVVLDLEASLARHPPACDAIAVDVRDEASIARAFEALAATAPTLGGFVNLAGFNRAVQPLAGTSAAEFDEVLGGNLRGAFLTARAALPLMGEGSAMVMVASGLASNVRAGFGAYAASKAGMIAMSKIFAVEAAPQVRVNVVAPAAVDTAFLRGGTGRSDERGAVALDLDSYVAATPMKRLAQPADVVGPIAFLLGPDSGFMTGQVLWINGGAYMP